MNAVWTSVWNRWPNSLDWPNPSIHFVFWFKYLCNKAVGFTTHLAVRKGWPSLGLFLLLTHHNLYRSFALSIVTQDHDSSYSKSMVFIDSDDLSQKSRPFIHEPVRPDDEMIYSFDVHNGLTLPIAICSVPVDYLLDWSSILVSPSSLLSSSAQDEEGNLIEFSSIQYQRDLELSPAFADADEVSNTLSSDKAMYENGYPFGPTSRRVRSSSTKYLTDLKEYISSSDFHIISPQIYW